MIYVDSSIIVRMIEGSDAVRIPIEERLALLNSSERMLATSRLSSLECRIKPLRESAVSLLELYDQFFSANELQVVEISPAVIEKATNVRAFHGLKTPDAIHAATATILNVAEFWTTDRRLARCPGLKFQLFPAV